MEDFRNLLTLAQIQELASDTDKCQFFRCLKGLQLCLFSEKNRLRGAKSESQSDNAFYDPQMASSVTLEEQIIFRNSIS
jgi:hypothetical protein